MRGTEMKGIERLLDWVGTLRLSGLVWADEMADELESTVDLIKREHAEDCCKMGLDYGAVSRVTADLERHLLGHEGMEDSPVARWARELREALGGDAEADEDRKAAAWVRDHGGLDEVRRRWKYLSHYADPVPRSCMERRLARLQRQIDESHAALRRRNQRIAVLASEINRAHNENRMEFMRRAGNCTAFFDEVCKRLAPQLRYMEGCTKDVMDAALEAPDRRLVPEGMEWPRYDTGEPVRIGGTVADELGYEHVVTSVELHDDGADLRWNPTEPEECVWVDHGEPVRRPSVLAADGEPLEAGQTVWLVDTGAEYWVKSGQTITADAVVIIRKTDCDCESEIVKASQLTHQRPVLDADGNRIEPAMDVWWVCEGDRRGVHAERLHVDGIDDDGEVECSPYNGGTSVVLEPSELYVNKPGLDADGVPIKEGDTVWPKYPYEEPDRQVESAEVVYVHRLGRIDIQAKYATGMSFRQQVDAKQLTHTKPEPRDSWERIEEDKGLNPFDYCKKVGHKLWTFDNAEEVKASDLVRRCKALAERERGE